MKLRMNSNSIRLRLSQTEVETFGKSGIVESFIPFGNSQLKYLIRSTSGGNDVTASFTDQCISILMPDTLSKEWVETDIVGFENKDQSSLKVLVEKDYKCLHERKSIDDSDSFPNPSA